MNIVVKDKYTNIEIDNYKKMIESNFILKEKEKQKDKIVKDLTIQKKRDSCK